MTPSHRPRVTLSITGGTGCTVMSRTTMSAGCIEGMSTDARSSRVGCWAVRAAPGVVGTTAEYRPPTAERSAVPRLSVVTRAAARPKPLGARTKPVAYPIGVWAESTR